MKENWVLLLSILLFLISCSNNESEIVKQNFQYTQNEYTQLINEIPEYNKYPRSINEEGELNLVEQGDWTTGFFPGALWLIYEYTQNDKWKKYPRKFTETLEGQKNNAGTHDIGFIMFNSFGNGYRITDKKEYKEILLSSAKTLTTRFDSTVGCIKSWDWSEDWQYPVIIDNMMNLELLFWATKVTGDSTYHDIAVTHAENTMKHHFRSDYSTYHLVDFDTTSGQVISKETVQGYADSSTWSRGHSWGLYGYTMCYRYTEKDKFLQQAQKMADFMLEHENLPQDMIPYWDFNAPNIPNEPRDASAAAITASAFFELDTFVDGKNYRKYADSILNSLSSKKYRAQDSNFIIDHCVGNKPNDSEIDVPLNYADYYFLEANLRKQKSGGKYNE